MKNIIKISLVLMLLIQSHIIQAQQNLNLNSLGFDGDVNAFVSDGTYTYVGGAFNFATINSVGKTGYGALVDKTTGNLLSNPYKIVRIFNDGTIFGALNAAIPDGSGGLVYRGKVQ